MAAGKRREMFGGHMPPQPVVCLAVPVPVNLLDSGVPTPVYTAYEQAHAEALVALQEWAEATVADGWTEHGCPCAECVLLRHALRLMACAIPIEEARGGERDRIAQDLLGQVYPPDPE